jgi:hypothetical protein
MQEIKQPISDALRIIINSSLLYNFLRISYPTQRDLLFGNH